MRAQSFPLPQLVPVTRHWDGDVGATDLFTPVGTPALAVFDGQAVAQVFPLGGNTVTLTAADGWVAYYAHLSQPGVSGRVAAGQQVGLVGQTGNAASSTPHLHFGLASSLAQLSAHNGGGDIDVLSWLAGQAPAAVAGAIAGATQPNLAPVSGGLGQGVPWWQSPPGLLLLGLGALFLFVED